MEASFEVNQLALTEWGWVRKVFEWEKMKSLAGLAGRSASSKDVEVVK